MNFLNIMRKKCTNSVPNKYCFTYSTENSGAQIVQVWKYWTRYWTSRNSTTY